MKRYRRAALALCLSAAAGLASGQAADESPVQVAQGLCDALIASMKSGAAAGFAARKSALEPEIRRAINLPLMTRIVVGPPWRSLTPEQQQDLTAAFSDFSISTYANQFSGYSGQSFAVDPKATPQASGDVIVRTTLKTGDPEPVKLDYLMRQISGEWKIIDVYLNGTISQLAARRSEFGSVLRNSGPSALIEMLKKKSAELSS
ncbi:MAG TPA: ABC transporter substrate-binding protein [Opitutaceae bacterium]